MTKRVISVLGVLLCCLIAPDIHALGKQGGGSGFTTITGTSVTEYIPATTNVFDATTSPCSTSAWCGTYYSSGSSWTNLSWHGYSGSNNAFGTNAAASASQSWLQAHNTYTFNSTSYSVGFSLCNGQSTTCWGQLVQGSNLNWAWTCGDNGNANCNYRAPYGTPIGSPTTKDWSCVSDRYTSGTNASFCDTGYYLTTTNNSGQIKITFDQSGKCGNCISGLAVYWGSVDPYNYITFYNADGSVGATVSGTQVFSSLPATGSNTTSGLVVFEPASGASTWSAVSFGSYNSNGSYAPAFEFDNLVFAPTACTTMSSTCTPSSPTGSELVGLDGLSTPTPEPSTLALFPAGLALAGACLKRRFTA